MRITSSSEYGTRIMVQLARAHGSKVLSAKALAEAENIPRDFVDQILMKLRRSGLVASHRGAGGGYLLARPPSEIHVADIVTAVEGRIFEDVCDRYSAGEMRCRHQDACGIRSVWVRLGLQVEGFLRGITLSSLLSESSSRVPHALANR